MFGDAVVHDSLSILERDRELVGVDSGTVGNDLAKKGVWGRRGLNLVLCVFFVKRVRVFGGRRKGGGWPGNASISGVVCLYFARCAECGFASDSWYCGCRA